MVKRTRINVTLYVVSFFVFNNGNRNYASRIPLWGLMYLLGTSTSRFRTVALNTAALYVQEPHKKVWSAYVSEWKQDYHCSLLILYSQ